MVKFRLQECMKNRLQPLQPAAPPLDSVPSFGAGMKFRLQAVGAYEDSASSLQWDTRHSETARPVVSPSQDRVNS